MKKSKKSVRHFIILIVCIIALFAGIFLKMKSGRITPLPDNTIGNTAGNIRGEGRFCEYEGKVYFANPYDGDTLYVMNPDGTKMKRLINNSVSYINAGGKYLFYYLQSRKGGSGLGYLRSSVGLYRSTLKGKDISCLDNDMLTMMVLIGDQIYYQHYDNTNFSTLHKISASDAYEEVELSTDIIETADAANGILYYSGIIKDQYLHAWKTQSDTTTVVLDSNTSYPTVLGDYVYYMDIDNDYRLFRYNFSSGQKEALTEERLDFYNIYKDVVFYQTSGTDAPALKRMSLNGGNPEIVKEGVFHRINTTSAYTYFQPFGDDSVIYRTSTLGALTVDTFPEAKEAALKYQKK